ncbi:MAG: KilA-N domain-containing protein [Saprospiraceae bacterium]
MKDSKITVQGIDVRLQIQQDFDFICITDIAKKFNPVPTDIIKAWMRNRNTVEFLGTWEMIHNEDFNLVEFDQIKMQTGLGSFVLTIKEWVEKTKAIGIMAKSGRYGGTFAHRDLALEFCSYVNPVFKLYLLKEFQRLKAEESLGQQLRWDLKRELTKANFFIHSDSVRENLVPMID